MAEIYQACVAGAARKLFAPMFRARWQNMQNIVNDSSFYTLIPDGYKTYYYAYIRQWTQWAQGFVPQLHRQDFFSTGIGYTVCDIFTRECMAGGYRFNSANAIAKEFITSWDSDRLAEIFNQMYFFANAGGNAIIALTPADGDIYPCVYPIDRVVFQIGRRGKIARATIFNRFTAGESCYYTRERRAVMNGENYYCVDIAKGTLALSPSFQGEKLAKVPKDVYAQWLDCYGSIRPSTWYKMPKKMQSLGLYNVKNKAVAVALKDLPGYSDSTLHTALDVLYSIDYNYTQSQVDQYMGKSRALVPKQMQKVSIKQPGSLTDGMDFLQAVEYQPPPLDDDFFAQVPDNNLNGDLMKPQFIQPDLRGEQHKLIRDSDLELLAAKVGLSPGDIATHLGEKTHMTATQVTVEQDTTETSVNNKRALASIAINDMLADVLYFYGIDGEVTIEWGRAAVNSAQENEELLRDYQAGALPLRTYLRKRWTDLSEEEVEKMAQEIEMERREQSEPTMDEYVRALNENSQQPAEYAGDSLGRGGNENTTGGER